MFQLLVLIVTATLDTHPQPPPTCTARLSASEAFWVAEPRLDDELDRQGVPVACEVRA